VPKSVTLAVIAR